MSAMAIIMYIWQRLGLLVPLTDHAELEAACRAVFQKLYTPDMHTCQNGLSPTNWSRRLEHSRLFPLSSGIKMSRQAVVVAVDTHEELSRGWLEEDRIH